MQDINDFSFQHLALSDANFTLHALKKTLSLCCFCALGRSEYVSAHSNHGNAAWAGQHGSSHPECRRLPPAPEPAALPNISTSNSLSGISRKRSCDSGCRASCQLGCGVHGQDAQPKLLQVGQASTLCCKLWNRCIFHKIL